MYVGGDEGGWGDFINISRLTRLRSEAAGLNGCYVRFHVHIRGVSIATGASAGPWSITPVTGDQPPDLTKSAGTPGFLSLEQTDTAALKSCSLTRLFNIFSRLMRLRSKAAGLCGCYVTFIHL